MSPDPEEPLRLFINPFTAWTSLAIKAGEMFLATAHVVAAKASTSDRSIEPAVPPAPPRAAAVDKPVVAKASKALAKRSAKANAKRKQKKRGRR
jgi:type IV secretory pathway TrbL component